MGSESLIRCSCVELILMILYDKIYVKTKNRFYALLLDGPGSRDAPQVRLDACSMAWARLPGCKHTQPAKLPGNENETRFSVAWLAWCVLCGWIWIQFLC